MAATRGSGRTEERSNTRSGNTTKRESAANTATSQQSRSGSTPSQSESTARGDQQRDLQTSRESGNVRPSSSPRRTELDQSGGSLPQFSSLVGSSPFGVMRRMMEDMDRLFSTFAGSPDPRSQQGLVRGGQRGVQPSTFRNLWAPQVEIFERGNNLVVRAELPGLAREDVDVEIDDDALVIRGERHNDVEDENDGYYRSERSYGSFYRAIPLPDGIDPNAANASFKDGVLEVTLPKPTPQVSRAKKINVR
jgi:HSP20 family protein